jgi:hypothetical protein
LTAAQPPSALPSPSPNQPFANKLTGSKGCVGCLAFAGLFFVVFTIANIAGCEWTKTNDAGSTTSSQPPKDPSLRYIGARGAVAGYDNYGRANRLPPGTAVRATDTFYVDPMNGPTKIYSVARVCRPNCAVCAAEVHRPVTRQRRQSSLSVRVHRLPLGAFSPLARSAWPRLLQKGRWPKAAQFLLVSATTGPRFVRFCAVCAAGGFVVSRHQRRQPFCPLQCLGLGRYRVGA